MELLAAFDGTLIRTVVCIAIGIFAGWFIPQPPFIKNLFGGGK